MRLREALSAEGQRDDMTYLIAVLDLIDPDRSEYVQYFEGVDAVVPLRYKRRSGPNPLDPFSMRSPMLKWRIMSSGRPVTPVSAT